jgi:hypothetical protein
MNSGGYGPGWYTDPGYRRRLEEQMRAAQENLHRSAQNLRQAPGYSDEHLADDIDAASPRMYPIKLAMTFDQDVVVTAVRAGDQTRKLRYGVDVTVGETAYVLVAGLRPVGLLIGNVVVPIEPGTE